MKQEKGKRKNNLGIWGWIAGIVLINIIFAQQFIRWDLTEGKRYSLSEVSIRTARNISYPLEVTSYLEGNFPLKIDRFQEALRTTLVEMNQYAKGRMDIRFIDPSKDKNARDTLRKYGFSPIGVQVQTSATEVARKAMYPVIRLQYGERSRFIDLLSDYQLPNGEPDLVQGEANLEYKIIAGIQTLLRDRPPTVAFLQGQDETPIEEIASDIGKDLTNSGYVLAYWNMNNPILRGRSFDNEVVDLIMILQPRSSFTEREKYELDQYLMRGGSILWILDYQEVDFDMYQKQRTLTRLHDHNLDDMFFQYGFKLNPDLVMDLSNEKIEVMQESASGPVFESRPWVYYPLMRNTPDHPVTRNVESVLLRFASTIDTLAKPGLQKQVLLQTSSRSRTQTNMQFIDLNATLMAANSPELFQSGPQITGLLVEGTFTSLFKGRRTPTDSLAKEPPSIPFVEQSQNPEDSRIAIISDGEFLRSKEFRGESSPFAPYDNRAFLLNLMDYLVGNEALSEIRAKEVVIRPLDTDKIRDHVVWIRLTNIGVPILLVLLFWGGRHLWRKRKYG